MVSRALERAGLAGLRLLSWLYYLAPDSLKNLLVRALAFILETTGLRAKVIRENLSIAYPGNDREAADRRVSMFRLAYVHLARLSCEILMLLGPMKRYVLKNAELHGVEHWKKAKQRGNGVLFLASHVGNWEVMAARGALAGIDIMLVTKHLKPEWIHQAIEEGRSKCQVQATYEPKTLRDVMFHLRRNGTVGFVLDQYTGAPVGVRVPVFGLPVGTSTALATLARRTGATVLPVVNYRGSHGRFVIEILPALEWIEDANPQRELALNTARYASVLESHIRTHPEQWLWTHRRFKGDLSPLREGEWLEGRPRR